MRLIEKIILWVLAVALLPLLITGTILYEAAHDNIQQQTVDHLNTIASIQAQRIASIQTNNLEELSNFTGELQLKTLIDQYNSAPTTAERTQIVKNLSELQEANTDITRVTVFAPTGVVVASTDTSLNGANYSQDQLFTIGLTQNHSTLIGQPTSQAPVFYLYGPLKLNHQLVGVAEIQMQANDLLDIVRDYTGLGSSGEIILAQKLTNSLGTYLTPLRFDSQAAFSRSISDPNSPIMKALTGQSMTYTNSSDYRGMKVIAVTRPIPNTNWGIVVQIDQSEALSSATLLGSEFLMLAFISSVLVVFTAIALAQRLTQPILDIDEVAEEVSRGKLVGRVKSISRDEVGNLATTFNTMLDNLEELDKAKSDFVSLASHQLRTPASGVKAIISLILHDYAKDLSQKQRDYLQQAFTSNERQLRVINDLLNVAMIESGKVKLTKTQTNLNQLVEDTVAEQLSVVESRHQKINIEKPPEQVIEMVDAEKMRMVLDNLVSNASKYTPDGGSITIGLRQQGELTKISVSDTGVGVSKEDMKKLFQKFSQIDNHLSHQGNGSAGLGLYLAKSVVELHGGTITVNSRPGEGTTFTIELKNAAR